MKYLEHAYKNKFSGEVEYIAGKENFKLPDLDWEMNRRKLLREFKQHLKNIVKDRE